MEERNAALSRREFLRLSGLAASGAVLAACAPRAPAATEVPPVATEAAEPTEPDEEPTEAPEPTDAPEAPAAEPVTLNLLLVTWSDEYRDVLEGEILPAFEEANAGVTVVPDYTTWGELDPKVMTAFAGGLAPDLFEADTIEFGVKYYVRDIISELEPFIEGTGGPEILDDFYQKAVYEGSTVEGKLVGIPYELDNRAEFYRKDLFEEVGLDPESPPEEWEDFREAAIELTVRENGTFIRAGYHVWPRAWSIQWFFPWMWQNGGTMLTETLDEAAFNSDAAVEALEFITNLLRVDEVGPLEEMPGVGDLSALAAGTQAIQHSGYGMISNTTKHAPEVAEQLGLFIPKKQTQGHLWYANTMHMTRGDHMDEAWDLVSHLLLDDENFLKHHEAMGSLPPRKSTAEQASHITGLYMRLIDDVMNAPGSRTTATVEYAGEVIPRVDEAIAKALYGQATPKEALDVAAEEANGIIARYLEGGS